MRARILRPGHAQDRSGITHPLQLLTLCPCRRSQATRRRHPGRREPQHRRRPAQGDQGLQRDPGATDPQRVVGRRRGVERAGRQCVSDGEKDPRGEREPHHRAPAWARQPPVGEEQQRDGNQRDRRGRNGVHDQEGDRPTGPKRRVRVFEQQRSLGEDEPGGEEEPADAVTGTADGDHGPDGRIRRRPEREHDVVANRGGQPGVRPQIHGIQHQAAGDHRRGHTPEGLADSS